MNSIFLLAQLEEAKEAFLDKRRVCRIAISWGSCTTTHSRPPQPIKTLTDLLGINSK